MGVIEGRLLGYYVDGWLQSDDLFLEGLIDVMTLDLIVGGIFSTLLGITYGFSLGVTEWTEIVSFYYSVCGYKYILRLVSSWGELYGKSLVSEIIIWFYSNLGSDSGLILGRYAGTSYDKRHGGGFVIRLFSKRETFRDKNRQPLGNYVGCNDYFIAW